MRSTVTANDPTCITSHVAHRMATIAFTRECGHTYRVYIFHTHVRKECEHTPHVRRESKELLGYVSRQLFVYPRFEIAGGIEDVAYIEKGQIRRRGPFARLVCA